MHITVRPTTLADAAVLPAIERSAGQRFLTVPALAWIADDHIVSAELHREYAAKGLSWLALVDDRPVGFLLGEAMETSLYIAEFSLHLAWQGKGIGRQLINTVAQWACEQGFTSLTLTTFRHVAGTHRCINIWDLKYWKRTRCRRHYARSERKKRRMASRLNRVVPCA